METTVAWAPCIIGKADTVVAMYLIKANVHATAPRNCALSRCLKEATLNRNVKIPVALKKNFGAGLKLITSKCRSLKVVALLDLNWQVHQIREWLVLWVDAMRLLKEDVYRKWVNNGRFQSHDGSGRSRATADREH
ncbi:hypothetical protein TNCV_4420501 [Trichonephila clavipes]|nr:hypothetical protein TNCV_4420501 [Trichonephila clavipes]